MTLEQLVAKQQLEIEKLKSVLEMYEKDREYIRCVLVGIGGPLNDNKLGYTSEQRAELRNIYSLVEFDERESDE